MYRVVFVDPQAASRATLREMLLQMDSVKLEAECEGYDRFVQMVFQWRPDVAIVAADPNSNRARGLIAELTAIFPGLRILVIIHGAHENLASELRTGASGYIAWPTTSERLLAALEGRLESREVPATSAAKDVGEEDDDVDLDDEDEMPMDDEADAAASDDEDEEERPLPRMAMGRPRSSRGGGFLGRLLRNIIPKRKIADATSKVPFPPQPFPHRLLNGFRQTSKRLWRYLPFSGSTGDLVDCTVFAPPAVSPGESVFVQVFAHLPEQAQAARDHAREFDEAAARRGFKSLEAEVKRGAKLTFHLVMPGAEIDDPVDDLVWRGAPASVQFLVKIPEEQNPGILVGTVSVSLDSIPMGHVKFKLTVGSVGEEFVGSHGPVGDAAQRYRKAFISYASPDRPEVLKRVQMLARLGIDYFQDVMKLEPGERWEKQLYRHIDESDLFLLFWSAAARDSQWVLKELRYALRRQANDGLAPPEIKPIVIEGPPPPPPPAELAHLHFNDYFLYFINPPRTQD